MTDDGKPCVLVSGGLDSAVALAETARERGPARPVFVRSGLAWEPAERYWLDRFLQTLPEGAVEPLVVLETPVADLYGEHWSVTGEDVPGAGSANEAVYLPGRNVLLLSKAGVFAAMEGCDALVMGPLSSSPFPDATPEFFETMGEALGRAMGREGPLAIETPLAGLEKPDVIRRGSVLRLDLTFSCIDPVGRLHCGACNKCAERKEGFAEAGVEDATEYAERVSG
ncbi:MAG: 7-cyano-7-deazaguanine synthase [Gemmatimonadota bacterium]|nr:7-cyano-7-deazaguanine synthase [Gemmatimonadota bacterium]